MTIRHFIPLALLIIVAFGTAAHYTNVPVPPVVIIASFALVILAFQLEEGRLVDIFKEIAAAFHRNRERHVH